VHFLQIWIVPNERGAEPRYQQVHFTEADKRGQLRQIISPEGADGALAVRQDARVYAGLFNGDEAADLTVAANRHVYVHVARGSVEVNGELMEEGDGARIRNAGSLHFARGEDAEVLVFDLRPNELPTMPH
jgi:redox-sensitive bicupin YhaK (pirin superfamily)